MRQGFVDDTPFGRFERLWTQFQTVSLIVYVTQCCSRDIEDGLPGADGRQPLVQQTSLLGTTGVQPWLPGPSDIMREKPVDVNLDNGFGTKAPFMLG